MERGASKEAKRKRVPVWALVLLPVAAAVVSNADVVLLGWARRRPQQIGEVTATLTTTIALSVLACVLTLWVLLRLRREVDRRAAAQAELRGAMADLESALDRERMLRAELDHRVRNNLSALLGLIGMYEGGAARPGDIASSLRGKIASLREAYNLIASTHGSGIELRELVERIVAVDERAAGVVRLTGPSVLLNSREANAMAMIVHELLTNAAKHGALRAPAVPGAPCGRIALEWMPVVRGDGVSVEMKWRERPVEAPARPGEGRGGGLGLTLIEGLAGSDLRGRVSFSARGDEWDVDIVANLRLPVGATEEKPARREVCP